MQQVKHKSAAAVGDISSADLNGGMHAVLCIAVDKLCCVLDVSVLLIS